MVDSRKSVKKVRKPTPSVEKKSGGASAYDSAIMNTSGLMDKSHNIYNTSADSSLTNMPSPFSSGMTLSSSSEASGISATNLNYFLPTFGAAGGGSAKAKAAPAKAKASSKAKVPAKAKAPTKAKAAATKSKK